MLIFRDFISYCYVGELVHAFRRELLPPRLHTARRVSLLLIAEITLTSDHERSDARDQATDRMQNSPRDVGVLNAWSGGCRVVVGRPMDDRNRMR